MTDDRELSLILDRWFDDGPTEMPDRVIDVVAIGISRQRQRPAWRLDRRLPRMITPIRAVAALAAVVFVAVLGYNLVGTPGQGVGGPGPVATPSPTPTPIPSPSAAVAAGTPSASAIVSPLEGVWATGPIPIADIKASMVAAGIAPGDADAWVAEVGSPTRYSFLLAFTGTAFTHSEETPDMAMQVGEAGTFALSGSQLVLTLGEPGNVDTYTFDTTLSTNELSLRCVDSTEQGTAEEKAKHRRYTIAFYCSAPFRRQP